MASALCVAFLGSCVFGQEPPPLGDVAKKQRKENASNTQHASHVITNDDIPKKTASPSTQSSDQPVTEPSDEDTADDSPDAEDAVDQKDESGDKEAKEKWLKNLQAAIRKHKKYIAALKDHLAYLEKQAGEPAQKSGGAASCGLYQEACENIRRLQAEIAHTKAQIETAQKELEQAQEEIRKMGYGNAVYDPD